MDVMKFIEQSNAAQTPDEIVTLFEQFVSFFGYTRIAYLGLTEESIKPLKLLTPDFRPAIACTYPESYLLHYKQSNYIKIDPVVQCAVNNNFAFLWNDVTQRVSLNKSQKGIFDDARSAQLYDGVTIPLHGAGLQKFAVCLARDRQGDGHDHRLLPLLQLSATQLHLAYLRLAREKPDASQGPLLSIRERECLSWIAVGKSSWAIGMILGLSEETVEKYIKSAIKKLNAPNRVAAVVNAMQNGAITL